MKKYQRLSHVERTKIDALFHLGWSVTEIANKLGRDKSTISRELSRYPFSYNGDKAQSQADRLARKHNCDRKLDINDPLFFYVYKKLKKRWSPEQISSSLKRNYPEDKSMQISHESIYTYIYVLGKGELRKELIGYLRQEKKIRNSRKGMQDKRGKIADMISIDERPAEVADRSLAGHWEGDLIIGKGHKSCIGTLVERKTKTVILLPLKSKDATIVRKAFEKEFKSLPKQMAVSLTYDQGNEMSEHKLFTKNTKMKVYFCHPASPWERGTNENTNMLIRDYFPKGTDFNKVPRKELKRVQHELNERIRKTLNWECPKDVFAAEILNQNR